MAGEANHFAVLVASDVAVGESFLPMPPNAHAIWNKRREQAMVCCWMVLGALAIGLGPAFGQTPQWIWRGDTNTAAGSAQTVYFRKTFRTPPLTWNARLAVSADDEAEVFLNSFPVATCRQWSEPARAEVSVRLNQGENVLAVRARNRSGRAGLLVHLNLNGQTNVVSDASWLVATNEEPNWSALQFNAAQWQAVRVIGAAGIAPWGDVLARASATPADALTSLPGFRVELLRSAEPGEGSWICLAFDERGRLLISPQGDDRPLLRLTVANGRVERVEPVAAPVRYAMGLLFAHGSLYANARGPEGAGLYRLIDRNGNDQFDRDEMKLLKKFEGGSEHGYHGLALGPDNRIYVLNGNGTKLPSGLAATSPHRNYREDVLSLNPDETTATDGPPAPAGYILRTDADGQEWELFAGGLRNSYGFDFNPDGELFVFDSDMEWDWGTPWYRPTRILHAVSGGEFGWRDGTRSWPDYYEDSLPSVVNVGIGSPTGVRFGTRSRFPPKYQRALFALDWSYGRIFAVHLEADGASYRGTVETFLRGTPLNLTDVAFGPEGAMYFITGGRNTQSGLYRISYVGPRPAGTDSPSELASADRAESEKRSLRHRLEQFHGRSDPAAVEMLWPHLGSVDRSIRYAARVALESQEIATWKSHALGETNVAAGLNSLLALARAGGAETQAALLKSLDRFPLESLSEQQKLLKLRVLQLGLLRQGRLASEPSQALAAELGRYYPAASWPLNRELSRLLLCLDAPGAVPGTLDLLAAAPTQEQQFHYLAQLRNVRGHWSIADRRRYFEWWLRSRENLPRAPELAPWFADAGRRPVDGAWVDKYLREFHRDAVATLQPEERQPLAALLQAPLQKSRQVPASNRKFERAWTMAELLPDLERASRRRNFERGRQAFVDAQCLTCHRFGNDGGTIGPELTAAGSKYDRRVLLESILEPSKVINEQYQLHTVTLRNGENVTGRLLRETAAEVVLETDAFSGARERFARAEVERLAPAALSSMPSGLVDVLSREDILDLLAYLECGGRSEASAFRKE
jgi:putative heme-binding domain-containing protein